MVWMIRELISVIVKALLLHLALLPLLPLALFLLLRLLRLFGQLLRVSATP